MHPSVRGQQPFVGQLVNVRGVRQDESMVVRTLKEQNLRLKQQIEFMVMERQQREQLRPAVLSELPIQPTNPIHVQSMMPNSLTNVDPSHNNILHGQINGVVSELRPGSSMPKRPPRVEEVLQRVAILRQNKFPSPRTTGQLNSLPSAPNVILENNNFLVASQIQSPQIATQFIPTQHNHLLAVAQQQQNYIGLPVGQANGTYIPLPTQSIPMEMMQAHLSQIQGNPTFFNRSLTNSQNPHLRLIQPQNTIMPSGNTNDSLQRVRDGTSQGNTHQADQVEETYLRKMSRLKKSSSTQKLKTKDSQPKSPIPPKSPTRRNFPPTNSVQTVDRILNGQSAIPTSSVTRQDTVGNSLRSSLAKPKQSTSPTKHQRYERYKNLRRKTISLEKSEPRNSSLNNSRMSASNQLYSDVYHLGERLSRNKIEEPSDRSLSNSMSIPQRTGQNRSQTVGANSLSMSSSKKLLDKRQLYLKGL